MAEEILLGIDIGTSAIKIAQVIKTENGVSFEKIGIKNLLDLPSVTNEIISEIIKGILTESAMMPGRALFALSGTNVTIRHLEFPKMGLESLEKAIRFEFKKEVTYSIDECNIDYKIVKEFESKGNDGASQKKYKVLAVGVEKKYLQKLSDIAKLAGLELGGFVPAPLAIYAYSKRMQEMNDLRPEEVAMFLDFGNSQITVNFITRKGLNFSKDINMGGSALATVVKTMYNSGGDQTAFTAEENKFKLGLLSQEKIDNLDDTSPEASLHKVLNTTFKKIFQRIRLSTGYFFAKFQESTISTQTIKKICIAGGNAEIPGVKEFFFEAYDAKITKAGCFDVVKLGASCDTELAEKYSTSFTMLGASFLEYYYPEYEITFQKTKAAADQTQKNYSAFFKEFIEKKIPWFKKVYEFGFVNSIIAVAVLYAFIFSALFLKDFYEIYTLDGEKKIIEKNIEQLNSAEMASKRQKIFEQYDIFQKKINSRDILEFKKNNLDGVMLSIADALPDASVINSLSFLNEEKPVLLFGGRTNIYDKVLKINEKLKKRNKFNKITVKKTEQVEDYVDFQFECVIAGSGKTGEEK